MDQLFSSKQLHSLFSSNEIQHIFIRWNWDLSTSHELQSLFHPVNSVRFSSFEIHSHFHHHEIQSRPLPMKFTSNINFMIWTNYSHPNYCTHCFHPITIGHILIPWITVTSTFHDTHHFFYLMEFFNPVLGC